MSRSLGNQLPAALVQLWDGRRLGQKARFAVLLTTIDARGYPHPAMLSVGEVLARDPQNLRLALYANSSTSNNLRRSGSLSLALAADGFAYYVKATAREMQGPLPNLQGLAAFAVTIDEVLEDGEAIAQVTSGFTIELTRESDKIVGSWERVIAALAVLP